MAQQPTPNSPSPNVIGEALHISTSSGAAVEMVYVTRSMLSYAVNENELQNISTMNGLTSLFLALATGLIGIALGILQVWAMEDSLSDTGEAVAKFAIPILALLALGFCIAAGTTWNSRRMQINTIKRESSSDG